VRPFGVSIDDGDGHILFRNDEFVKMSLHAARHPVQADWYARAYPRKNTEHRCSQSGRRIYDGCALARPSDHPSGRII